MISPATELVIAKQWLAGKTARFIAEKLGLNLRVVTRIVQRLQSQGILKFRGPETSYGKSLRVQRILAEDERT